MSCRIYLQIPNGSAFERTETGSRSIAESVVKTFLEPDELEDTEVSLYLVYQRLTLAVHRFDATQGTQDNWQGRTGKLPGQKGRDKLVGQRNGKAAPGIMSILMQ